MNAAKPIALDSNILIRAVEGEDNDPVSVACRRLIFDDESTNAFIVSELLLSEVLVLPLRDGNVALSRFYRRLLTDLRAFRMIPVSRTILIEAAKLRSVSSLKLPDAIHLATATRSGCSVIVSMDQKLSAPGGITVVEPGDSRLTARGR